jgi:hypothetical protein
MKAKVVPWSSIVGTGVMLLNDDGSVRANLIVTNVKCDTARGEQIREASSDLAHGIANLVNKYWSES